jgi:hypothetical protein
MPKHPHILNAASTLLGIALLLITGLNVARFSSFGDEVAWAAAALLSVSCLSSYLALRNQPDGGGRYENIADLSFLGGLVALLLAVLLVAVR